VPVGLPASFGGCCSGAGKPEPRGAGRYRLVWDFRGSPDPKDAPGRHADGRVRDRSGWVPGPRATTTGSKISRVAGSGNDGDGAGFGVAGIGVANGPDRRALRLTAAAATLSMRSTRRCSSSGSKPTANATAGQTCDNQHRSGLRAHIGRISRVSSTGRTRASR
jgi:hypothetical protein